MEGRRERSTTSDGVASGSGEALLLNFLDGFRDFEREGVPYGAASAAAQASGASTSHASFIGNLESSSAAANHVTLSIGGLSRVLLSLGEPHCAWRAVHVGGTKGKGSTSAMVASSLLAAGVKTGRYGSPHVHTIRERINTFKGNSGACNQSWQTGGNQIESLSPTMISDDALGELVDTWAPRLESAQRRMSIRLTHFEVLTALSFLHFADTGCDAVVVEVGLGGEKDATNVIPPSSLAMAVVTSVGEEHVDALGGSIAAVAQAKAGIAKKDRVLLLGAGAFQGTSRDIVRSVALQKGARIVDTSGIRMQVHSSSCNDFIGNGMQEAVSEVGISRQERERWEIYVPEFGEAFLVNSPAMMGAFQRNNAVTAAKVMSCLHEEESTKIFPRGHHLEDIKDALIAGLESCSLPGRFEIITPEKLLLDSNVAKRTVCIIDGAHTASSAEMLAKSVQELFPAANSIILVVAMAADKDHDGFARAMQRGLSPAAVICCETNIAGSEKRSFCTLRMKEIWQRMILNENDRNKNVNRSNGLRGKEDALLGSCTLLLGEKDESIESGLHKAFELIEKKATEKYTRESPADIETHIDNVVIVTGSLHAAGNALKVIK